MAVIAEKQADTATLLDDLAGLLDAETAWTKETSTGIENTGLQDDGVTTTNAWDKNGYLYSHSGMGIYLCMFIATAFWDDDGTDGRTTSKGIRFHVSTDWDFTLNHPAGQTDAQPRDPWYNDVGFNRYQSFTDQHFHSDQDQQTNRSPAGIWWWDGNPGNHAFRTEDVSYFMSATNDWINIAAWNTINSTNGSAGYLTFEHANAKFWNDGNIPYFLFTNTNSGGGGDEHSGRVAQYGFSHIYGRGGHVEHPYQSVSGFTQGAWGIVNPDANDDTFFFRRPVVYQSHAKRVPVHYANTVISNDHTEGASHGDEITHGTETYRIMRQAGLSESFPMSAGLRYE